MRAFLLLMLLTFCTPPSHADKMRAGYSQGKAFSNLKQGESISSVQSADVQQVPGFEISTPSAANYFENGGADLTHEASKTTTEARTFIEDSKARRRHFTLDTAKDPLLVRSEAVLKEREDPQDVNQEEDERDAVSSSHHECVESKEPQEAACLSTLEIKTKIVTGNPLYEKCCVRQSCREECWGWGWNRKCRDVCECAEWQDYLLGHEPDQVVIESETWNDTCAHVELLSDQGQCTYVEKRCIQESETQGSETQGPETRTINGANIHRECWQYRSTYMCEHPQKEGCKALREKGCFQVASACQTSNGKGCVAYKQTYKCLENSGGKKSRRLKNTLKNALDAFCAEGSCADQTYEFNKDMLDSISKLQILKEMQGGVAGEPLAVFKGQDRRCSKSKFSFSDCCGLSGGWGETTKMTSCSGEEKDLNQRRAKGLCRLVGTYCVEKEKLTKVCLREKTSYCCFSSKLSRLFQEQGRSQLGLGWGEPEHPSCRGLIVEELQRVDFSKIDSREIFSEIASRYKPGNQTKAVDTSVLEAKTLHSIEANMRQMKEGLNGKSL